MSQQDEMVRAAQRLLLNNYRQAPVVMTRGEGCALWDADGRRYLDMTAGIAVCVLGHGHAGLADAIAAQARRLLHASNLYFIESQLRFADALSARAFRGRAFFCNSGTEANEAAL
jgi:acetylornithine/succinyldiaminopimelate/putrescine aminotransferase